MVWIVEADTKGFNWKPGRYESEVVTRWWWGCFAVSKLKWSHREYAETPLLWEGGRE